jgi:Fe-Mn family superoxide dismutase
MIMMSYSIETSLKDLLIYIICKLHTLFMTIIFLSSMKKYELPPLPYAYDALEPHIDARTMEIHHTKHHQTYTDKLNAALEKCPPNIQEKDIVEILSSSLDQVPADQKSAINFNGGGFDNHRIFWNNMKQNGGGEPGGSIADAINTSFGSFSDFKEKFSSATALIQGSGWGWLVYNSSAKKVEYKAMPNQTSPRTEGLIPLLGCDVWEHAYYLKYQNKRPDYISAWWNVVNWDDTAKRYDRLNK